MKCSLEVRRILFVLILLFLAMQAFALNIGGVDGTGSQVFAFDEPAVFSNWPEDYKNLCLQHMNAVIKKCSESGYENWFVDRMVSATKFSPEVARYSVEDLVVGNESCSYAENTIDEVRVINATLTFACTQTNFCEAPRSDQYACSFSCHAWDCDSDITPNDIYLCPGEGVKFDTTKDPFTQAGRSCREDAQKLCESRGPECELQTPCEYKQKAGQELAFCGCSCESEPPESTISGEDLERAQQETFDIDTFSFQEWQNERGGMCGGTVKKSDVRKEVKNISKMVYTPPASKRIIAKSKLNFSEKAGKVAGTSSGKAAVETEVNSAIAAFLDKNSCDPTQSKPTDAVNAWIPDPSSKPMDDSTTHIIDNLPKNEDVNETSPDTVAIDSNVNACVEDWSCTNWTSGTWSSCSNGVQTLTKSRKCSDRNSCGTIIEKPKVSETERKSCGDAVTGMNDGNTSTVTCTENWSCGSWSEWDSCLSGIQARARACADANHCTTTTNRPAISESRACSDTTAPPCTESWNCGEWNIGSWGACQEGGTQTRTNTRSCADANNCGTTTNKPDISQTDSQVCIYTPPKEYHEKENYLSMVSGGTVTISAGPAVNFSLGSEQSAIYVLDMAYGKTYEITIAATGPLSITYQQRYGPPQVNYTDGPAGSGKTTISGGPNTASYGEVQKMAIKLGPATSSLNGQITITQLN